MPSSEFETQFNRKQQLRLERLQFIYPYEIAKMAKSITHTSILHRCRERVLGLPLIGTFLSNRLPATAPQANIFLQRQRAENLEPNQAEPFDYEEEVEDLYDRVTEKLRQTSEPIQRGTPISPNTLYKWRYLGGKEELTLGFYEGGIRNKTLEIYYHCRPHWWEREQRVIYKGDIKDCEDFSLQRIQERNGKESPFIWKHEVTLGHWSVGDTLEIDLAELSDAIDRLFFPEEDTKQEEKILWSNSEENSQKP